MHRSRSVPRTAREILRAEYGSARNFMTPHVITRGKLARSVAYELSSGNGREWGTSIFGVSVVRVREDGSTERDYDASCCFSTLDGANEHVRRLTAIEGAREDA